MESIKQGSSQNAAGISSVIAVSVNGVSKADMTIAVATAVSPLS